MLSSKFMVSAHPPQNELSEQMTRLPNRLCHQRPQAGQRRNACLPMYIRPGEPDPWYPPLPHRRLGLPVRQCPLTFPHQKRGVLQPRLAF
jgi:hypothetical protein